MTDASPKAPEPLVDDDGVGASELAEFLVNAEMASPEPYVFVIDDNGRALVGAQIKDGIVVLSFGE
jgi:hypothetical protein